MSTKFKVTADSPAAWSEELRCHWLMWSAFGPKRLRLDLPEGNCCDMDGVISIALRIMPDVFFIDCYVGNFPDMRYERVDRSGRWQEYNLRGFAVAARS